MKTNFDLRRLAARLIVIGIFGLYFVGIILMQFSSADYDSQAEGNYITYLHETPPRGEIFDRNGKYLVQNQVCYDLIITPAKVERPLDTVRFAEITGVDLWRIRRALKRVKASSYDKTIIARRLSAEANLRLQEGGWEGFTTKARTMRNYPRPIAAHLLGYIAEIDDKTLISRATENFYEERDYIGKSGLEAEYEQQLRGEKGLVRHNRREKSEEIITPRIAGKNLICTIDSRLQEFAEELLRDKVGSVVAIEPSTGEILVMASSPTYDPNESSGPQWGNYYMQLLNHEVRRPLLNRATKSSQPPGSTFKLVNALIGLQEGVLKPSYRYECHLGYQYGKKKMGCHPHASPLNLDYAIATSCNAYFCNVFRSILENKRYGSSKEGYEVWRDYVESFGFGVGLGVDFPNEISGYVPPRRFYDRIHHSRWNALTVLSLAIGQGELLCSTLQLANLAATIANRGYFYTPHTVSMIGCDSIGEEYRTRHYTKVERQHFESVIKGMWRAVNVDGTCRTANLAGFDVCGKTGTSQNPKGDDHSTFVSFAPRNNPKIAIAAYIEHGRSGAEAAVPIASLIEELYLTDTVKRPELVNYVKNLKLNYWRAYDSKKKKKQ